MSTQNISVTGSRRTNISAISSPKINLSVGGKLDTGA